MNACPVLHCSKRENAALSSARRWGVGRVLGAMRLAGANESRRAVASHCVRQLERRRSEESRLARVLDSETGSVGGRNTPPFANLCGFHNIDLKTYPNRAGE